MKNLAVIAAMALSIPAAAEVSVTFDFHDTMSLNPTVNEPGEKQGIALDGRTFTAGVVEVSFKANEDGNTQVRLYNSYDAGVDLRLYDGDAMTVSVTDGSQYLKSIKFTMSLSGAASGSNDINFIPSTGDFDWAAETWTPDEGDKPGSVVLTSAEQSRIYTMTVTLDELTAIAEVEEGAMPAEATYYTLLGRPVSPSRLVPGIYIRVCGPETVKTIIK